MSVLRQIEVIGGQRNRNQDSSDRNRTHSLNEEALRKYAAYILLCSFTLFICILTVVSTGIVNVELCLCSRLAVCLLICILLHAAVHNDGTYYLRLTALPTFSLLCDFYTTLHVPPRSVEYLAPLTTRLVSLFC